MTQIIDLEAVRDQRDLAALEQDEALWWAFVQRLVGELVNADMSVESARSAGYRALFDFLLLSGLEYGEAIKFLSQCVKVQDSVGRWPGPDTPF